MPGRQRRLSTRDVVRALASFGFAVVPGGKGSHVKLRRETEGGRQTLMVPQANPIAPGTLRSIYKSATSFIPESELRPHFYED